MADTTTGTTATSPGTARPGNGRAIEAEGLRKSYGEVEALCGVDLRVPDGHRARPARPERRRQDDRRAHPHHAAARPTAARARVAGLDVVRDAAALRAQIGLAGQYAAVDENLTGVENLEMVGRLYHLRPRGRARRGPTSCSSASTSPTPATRLVQAPTPAACAAGSTSPPRWWPARRCCSSTSRPPASTRAAASACGRRSRRASPAGTTVLLTTQYLDEADRLADRIAVIDHGARDRRGHLRRAQGPGRRRAARGHARGPGPAPTRRSRRSAPMGDEPPRVRRRRRCACRCASAAARSPRRCGASTRPGSAIDDIAAAPADARRRLPRADRPRRRAGRGGRGRRRRGAEARRRPR